MKKFIILMAVFAIGTTMFATSAFADAAFNAPGAMPTVTVTNGTTQPCNFGSIDGCWKTSTTASPGDMIAVHLYFDNTSSETATNVMLGIEPSRNGTLVTFNGGVTASNAPRATGTATVTLSQVETITSEPQSGPLQADWYPSANSAAQPVNTDQLFGSGFPIGNMAPGAQGVLVVRFIVNGTATPPAGGSCVINNFGSNPSTISLGGSSSLSWTTSNCNYVNISSVGSNLATDNSGYSVSPTNTTTYTLTAYPGGATATTTVTVKNTTPPTNTCSINNFTANPSSIQTGGSSSLNWNTTNCTSVNITSLGSNLSADGSQSVSPANTTSYTLTAYPGGQTSTVTVTVNNVTNNSCVINNFTASPSSIQSGGSSNLNWNTTNCSYVTVSGIGQLANNGNQAVYPGNTTTYTLSAYPGGQTSQVTVYVNSNNYNYCSINSFYVDSNSLTQGQTTTLHWSTSGTNTVYISGFGNEPASGAISISPYQSTTYTLSMNNNGNCSGGGSQSIYVTVGQPYYGGGGQQGSQPQAITTVASVVSSYSAVLNGIAVPNTNYGVTNAWFEYGSSPSMGSTTNQQAVTSYGSTPYSANISGLEPGATYYYRADVQNQNGVAYGSVVPFTIPSVTTTTAITPPTRVIVETRTVTTNNGIVAKSQASLFKFEVDSSFDHMCIGGDITYTVNYQNISNEDLQNSILRITFPGELDYASSSQGDYDVTDRTLTISLGTVQAGEQGSVTVNAAVNNQAVAGKLSVITATMVYTNPTTQAQEQAIAYSLITISNDCPSVLGASVFGLGSFLPQTLLAWLLLILVILTLIVLARSLSRKKEEPAKTA